MGIKKQIQNTDSEKYMGRADRVLKKLEEEGRVVVIPGYRLFGEEYTASILDAKQQFDLKHKNSIEYNCQNGI